MGRKLHIVNERGKIKVNEETYAFPYGKKCGFFQINNWKFDEMILRFI